MHNIPGQTNEARVHGRKRYGRLWQPNQHLPLFLQPLGLLFLQSLDLLSQMFFLYVRSFNWGYTKNHLNMSKHDCIPKRESTNWPLMKSLVNLISLVAPLLLELISLPFLFFQNLTWYELIYRPSLVISLPTSSTIAQIFWRFI